MAKRKNILPNDVRDWLSVLSIIGFIAILLQYAFGISFLSNNMTAIFLLVAGAILLMVGKVFTVKRWVSDGIQQNEFSQLFALVFGIAAMIFAVLLFIGMLPANSEGLIGYLALPPAIFIFFDYLSKNT